MTKRRRIIQERLSRSGSGWGGMFVGGGLSLLLSIVLILALGSYTPQADSAAYGNIARSIVRGRGIAVTSTDPQTNRVIAIPDTFRSPLYPIALAPAFAIGDIRLAQLSTAAFGAIAVMLLFAVVRELWGGRAAWIATVLAAVYPPLLICDVGFLTEPLFLAFELSALLALLRFRRDPRYVLWPIVVGVLIGLASLTRANGLLILPLAMIGLWCASSDRRHGTKAAAVALVAAMLTLAPWTIRNELVLGDFVPTSTETGYALTTVLNDRSRADSAESVFSVAPEIASVAHISLQRLRQVSQTLDSAEIGNKLLARAWRYARAHPGYAIKAETLNVLRSLDLTKGSYTGFTAYRALGVPASPIWSLLIPSTYVVYALALLGGLALFRRPDLTRPPFVFYLVPLVLLVSSGLVAGGMRYRVPLDTLLLAFAGLGLATYGQDLTPGRWKLGSATQQSTLRRPDRVTSKER